MLKASIESSKPNGADIFQTPETYRTMLFASDASKSAYESAGLTGLALENVTKSSVVTS